MAVQSYSCGCTYEMNMLIAVCPLHAENVRKNVSDALEDSQISKQKKLSDGKKAAQAYLKARVEELDRSMARNFSLGNFTLAAHDGRRLSAILDVLGEMDLS